MMIHDNDKSREELLREVVELRNRVSELEELDAQCCEVNEKLAHAELYAQHIISSSLDMIVAVDPNRRICRFNEAAQKTFGYSVEEVLGKHVSMLYSSFDEGSSAHESLRVNGFYRGEITNKRKDGSLFPTFLSASVLHDKQGKFIGFMGISRDITELKKVADELMKMKNFEAVSILSRGIAHDFNNLLTGVLGNISLVKTYLEPEHKFFDLLTRAENSTVQAHELTLQLYTYAKSAEPDRKKLFLEGLIRDATESALKDTDIKCNYELSPSLCPVEVDERHMSRVIYNIVVNAANSMPGSGEIKISAENIVIDKGSPLNSNLRGGDYVRIAIRDSGKGIPAEHLNNIYVPYSDSRGYGCRSGSGLGLALCYYVLKNHRGLINIESEQGKGTNVTIYLPVAPPDR